MPLYEFRCSKCSRRFAQLVGMTADSADPVCPHCGSRDVSKLISRFTRARSEDETLDSLEDAALAGDMDDPRSMRRWFKEMGRAMDEEGGEDFEEYLDEAEREFYEGSDETGADDES